METTAMTSDNAAAVGLVESGLAQLEASGLKTAALGVRALLDRQIADTPTAVVSDGDSSVGPGGLIAKAFEIAGTLIGAPRGKLGGQDNAYPTESIISGSLVGNDTAAEVDSAGYMPSDYVGAGSVGENVFTGGAIDDRDTSPLRAFAAAANIIDSNQAVASAIVDGFGIAGEIVEAGFGGLGAALVETETTGDGFRAVADYIGTNPEGLDQITRTFSVVAEVVIDQLEGMGISPSVAGSISTALQAVGDHLKSGDLTNEEAQSLFELVGQATDMYGDPVSAVASLVGSLPEGLSPAISFASNALLTAEAAVPQFPGVTSDFSTSG